MHCCWHADCQKQDRIQEATQNCAYLTMGEDTYLVSE